MDASLRVREKKVSFSLSSPGIDVSLLIALCAAIIDFLSITQPWLVGLNNEYLAGKGLTYSIAAEMSGVQLMQTQQYLSILLIPVALTGLMWFLANTPEDATARVSYKTKCELMLIMCIAFSIIPPYIFSNKLAVGINMTSGSNVFASRWELGSGETLPAYSGLGFAAALLIRTFKD